jgi:hypothetical protein
MPCLPSHDPTIQSTPILPRQTLPDRAERFAASPIPPRLAKRIRAQSILPRRATAFGTLPNHAPPATPIADERCRPCHALPAMPCLDAPGLALPRLPCLASAIAVMPRRSLPAASSRAVPTLAQPAARCITPPCRCSSRHPVRACLPRQTTRSLATARRAMTGLCVLAVPAGTRPAMPCRCFRFPALRCLPCQAPPVRVPPDASMPCLTCRALPDACATVRAVALPFLPCPAKSRPDNPRRTCRADPARAGRLVALPAVPSRAIPSETYRGRA